LFAGVEALRMTALKIPQHVVLNQTVRMECNFNLDRENLYSVKWYKDGHEFYRYVPKEQPDVHVFALAGVSVDVCIFSELFLSLWYLPSTLAVQLLRMSLVFLLKENTSIRRERFD
jgi:hypothetical protein